MNDFDQTIHTIEGSLQDLGTQDQRLVVGLMRGILLLANAAYQDPRALATLRQTRELLEQGQKTAAMEVIRDWQARRLLAEALPGWE